MNQFKSGQSEEQKVYRPENVKKKIIKEILGVSSWNFFNVYIDCALLTKVNS